MSHTLEKELPDFKSCAKHCIEVSKAYYACLTTNEYGSTYLDPVKCKANNFDPRKATKEQEERILWIPEICDKIEKERGTQAVQEELLAALDYYNTLSKPVLSKLKKDKLFPHSDNVPIRMNNEQNFRVMFEGEAESLNVMHKAVPESIEKQSRELNLIQAFKLIGNKILFYNSYVEVITVKATKDGIFLDVEENVDGELIRYEIDYEKNVVPYSQDSI